MRFILTVILILSASAQAFSAELISFESAEGMKRLERSDAKIDFFPLANHFESQENKVFCGVASSVIVLNTLRLKNADFDLPKDNILLTKEERRYLPQGFDPIYKRYTQRSLLNSNTKSRMEVFGKPVNINGKTVSDYGLQLWQLAALLKSYGLDITSRVVNDSLKDDDIRKELIENLENSGDYVLVNYSRKSLGQEGGGHISPLAAYDKKSDSFLVLDVSPNTARWVWVVAKDLFAAMRTFDTIENRGYLLVREGS